MSASVVRLFALLLAAALASVAHASMRAPDVIVTLRKLDARTGAEQWSFTLPRHQLPSRGELYPGRIVIASYFSGDQPAAPAPELFFLDAATGRIAPAFDPRAFTLKDDDPLLANSGPAAISATDDRGEIVLPNKWTSYGIARLPWWNAGPNKIYFFSRQNWDLAWTLVVPVGVRIVANWNDVLVYQQSIHPDPQTSAGHLFGQRAGTDKPQWEFVLPPDVADEEVRVFDVPGRFLSRDFAHAIGRTSVFVFNGSQVFALNPASGAIRWRRAVAPSLVPAQPAIRFPNPGIREIPGTDSLMLFSRDTGKSGVLVLFDTTTPAKATVLRTDLLSGPPPFSHDGAIYCFTEAPPPAEPVAPPATKR